MVAREVGRHLGFLGLPQERGLLFLLSMEALKGETEEDNLAGAAQADIHKGDKK